MSKDSTYGEIASNDGVHVHVGDINVLRWRGYYYDDETGLYFINGRWYDPETCRYLSPSAYNTAGAEILGGHSRYSYANNNPVSCKQKVINNFQAANSTKNLTINIANISINSVNYWRLHARGKWFDTDWPEFINITQNKIELISWSFSIYNERLYFDERENYSLYIAGGNISSYLGISSDGFGLDIGANVLEIGYDGRILDASVEFLTVGITFMYKDGILEIGIGALLIGGSVSIDIDEIFKEFIGG